MATIGIVHLPAWGHMRTLRAVSGALAQRGHRVIAWVQPNVRQLAEAPGVEVRCIGTPGNGARPTNWAFAVATIASITPPLTAELLRDRHLGEVEVLVYDSSAAWGRVAALKLDLPTASSHPMLAWVPGVPTFDDMRDLAAIAIGAGPGGAVGAARVILKSNRIISRRYGVRLGGLRALMQGPADRTLVYTSRELHPCADRFDASFRFVGPLVDEDASEDDPVLDRLDDDLPLVYCSFGTLFTDRPDLYRMLIDALADEPVSVLLDVGHEVDLEVLGPVAENTVIHRRVVPAAALRRARVFVTHAGMNSIQEALLAGVAMVCVPQAADQFRNARRMRSLGVSETIRRATPAALRTAVVRMLADEGSRRRARTLAEGLRTAGSPQTAADAVEELLDGPRRR